MNSCTQIQPHISKSEKELTFLTTTASDNCAVVWSKGETVKTYLDSFT